jgi:hypothetical protein
MLDHLLLLAAKGRIAIDPVEDAKRRTLRAEQRIAR